MFGIDDAISAGLKVVGQVIDRAWPDPAEAAKQKLEAEKALRESLAGWDRQQAEINRVEAASPSMFVAGWRPFIGWVCGGALAYTYVLAPFFVFGSQWFGVVPPKLPVLDEHLYELLIAMLGFAGLKTYEMAQGIQTLRIGKP